MDPWQIIAALATAFATVVGILWREHVRTDAREQARGDRTEALLDLSLQNNRDAIAAWAKRDATDAARKRQTD